MKYEKMSITWLVFLYLTLKGWGRMWGYDWARKANKYMF